MNTSSYPKGFSLIEVLVSLLILGIGVIGFVALALQSHRRIEETGNRTQAHVVALDVIERIYANTAGWPASYNNDQNRWNSSARSPSACLKATPCTNPADMAVQDIQEVQDNLSRVLPLGKVLVRENCNGNEPTPCVVVAWLETDTSGCDPTDISVDDSVSHCIIVKFWPES